MNTREVTKADYVNAQSVQKLRPYAITIFIVTTWTDFSTKLEYRAWEGSFPLYTR